MRRLLGEDNAPAVVEGYGAIPASVARELVRDAVADPVELLQEGVRRVGVLTPIGLAPASCRQSRYAPTKSV